MHHDLIVTQRDRQAGRDHVRQLGLRRRSDQHHPLRTEPFDLCPGAIGGAARLEPNALGQGLMDEVHPSSLPDSSNCSKGFSIHHRERHECARARSVPPWSPGFR